MKKLIALLLIALVIPLFGAMDFNGTSQWLSEGSATSWKWLHGGEDQTAFQFTLMTWVKTTNTGAFQILFDTNDGGASTKVGTAWFLSARVPGIIIGEGNNGQQVCFIQGDADSFPDDGEWHHVAFTYNQALATDNGISYVDGVAAGSGNKTANTPSLSDPNGPIHIAIDEGEDGNGCIGQFQDGRTYKRALTPEEIKTIYIARGHDTILDGLWTRWLMNDGNEGVVAIGVIADVSSQLKEATASGSPTFSASELSFKRRVR